MLVVSVTVAFTGCGKKNKTNNTADRTENTQTTADSKRVADSALHLMQEVWDEYEEEETFAASGGDAANAVNNKPGKFAITDVENLNHTLALPEESVELIDDCASLTHMLNTNTFTAAAFHLKYPASLGTLAESLKNNIQSRQWLSGYPDKFLIAQVGSNYVVSAFGSEELMNTFKKNLLDEYEETIIIYEENMIFQNYTE